jgi:Zn-finger nucleic acid-binding protein
VDAPVLHCANCGGDLPERVRTCPYCHWVVEARRCGECFHLNLDSAVHCAACGCELGLEPVPEPEDLACPACEASFVGIPAGESGRVHECTRCSGQWVDHPTLRALFAQRLHVALGPVSRPVEAAPASERIRYLPCPVCRALMNRKNFGERSGVIVDVCKPHGIWFDPGELPRVLAFVETGGLEEAARREQEREREQKRAIAEAASHVTAGFDDVAALDGATGFFDFLLGLLRESKWKIGPP